jgi:sugar lactone lactonase YvrE
MCSPIRSITIPTLMLAIYALPSASATTIATYPIGTLLENIAIAPSGNLYITAIESGSVFRVSPSGASQLFGQVPGPATGISFTIDGSPVVASGTSLYRFAPDGTPLLAADITGAQYLNGIALLSPGVFLAADDTANTIWLANLVTGTSQPWSTDPLLLPGPGGPPFSPNGIKLFRNAVYVSNTGSGTIVRIPILPNGSAGIAQVYLTSLQADDFAFGTDGTLFAATQGGEIARVAPNGARTTLPTSTFGNAAVAFGRTSADRQDIYVVNNGGAFLDLPGGTKAASVVRLAAGINGVVPEQQAVPEPSSFGLSITGTVARLGLFTKCRRRYPGAGTDDQLNHPENDSNR